MREHVWTWSGTYFGYRQDNKLWTHSGILAGKFFEDEVYGSSGQYLGEVKNKKRLITKVSKKPKRKSAFSSAVRRGAIARRANYAGYAMYAGYEDFPAPEDFN